MKNYEKIEYPISISERYHEEIIRIENLLNRFEYGSIYEVSGNRFDGSIKTVQRRLSKEIFGLLCKIQFGEKSDREILKEEPMKLHVLSKTEDETDELDSK